VKLRGYATLTSTYFVDEVLDLGDVVAMRCPNEPDFVDGNLLTFPRAPTERDRADWEARFDAEFGDLPDVTRRAFFWDDPQGGEGAAASFEAAGYEVERSTVRLAVPGDLRPPERRPEGYTLDQAMNDEDWAAIPVLQARDSEGRDHHSARLRRLEARARFLRRVAEGARPGLRGGWFIARLHGTPVGTVGLFVREGLARYAFVHVVPTARRQGVATAMVHDVARIGFDAWGAHTLVLMADEGSAADGIYARLGFRLVQRDVGLVERAGARSS